jgi:hypothetical protein
LVGPLAIRSGQSFRRPNVVIFFLLRSTSLRPFAAIFASFFDSVAKWIQAPPCRLYLAQAMAQPIEKAALQQEKRDGVGLKKGPPSPPKD